MKASNATPSFQWKEQVSDVVAEKFIEYVDCWETSGFSKDPLHNTDPYPYKHTEIDSYFVKGFSSTVPTRI